MKHKAESRLYPNEAHKQREWSHAISVLMIDPDGFAHLPPEIETGPHCRLSQLPSREAIMFVAGAPALIHTAYGNYKIIYIWRLCWRNASLYS